MTLDEFVAAYRKVDRVPWKELDEPLLQYCRDNPDHADVGVVFAKVALVNRVYRANLQMGKSGAESEMAKALVLAGADDFLGPLWQVDCLERSSLPVLLTAHGWTVHHGKEATGRVALSFASKYLSFHNPGVVPIYDDFAWKTAMALVGRRVDRRAHRGFLNTRYAHFCEAVLLLMEELESRGHQPDMKKLDVVLYGFRDGVKA